jgi:hypothetical protein
MYKDYYLKFPDKQTALDEFAKLNLTYDLQSPETVYSTPVGIASTAINPETNEEYTYTYYKEEPTELATYTKGFIDQTPNAAIDVGGTIYTDGVYETNESGEVITVTPQEPLEGFHINYRIVWGEAEEIPLAENLISYMVSPQQPVRQFF